MAADKQVSITVNTTEKKVNKRKYSYSEIVEMAVPGSGESTAYLVKYSENEHAKNSTRLSPGDDVMVHEGMVFRVTPTGES
jgi:hypothetical protein